ncbi:MAG: AP2 domain-containing protein [Verrucomicrobiales bacterium]|nr:AP2 domain-containing protein [Verrucomicrobiales bacterium]
MNADQPEYAISRIDQPDRGTRGWLVRLQRNGVRHQEFFSDAAWDGAERALERARQFRDRLLAHARRVSKRRTTVRTHSAITERNQSGVIGVSRVSQTGPNGASYHFWQATWSPRRGERKSVRFSVLKLGDEEAFRLACEARESGVAGEDS